MFHFCNLLLLQLLMRPSTVGNIPVVSPLQCRKASCFMPCAPAYKGAAGHGAIGNKLCSCNTLLQLCPGVTRLWLSRSCCLATNTIHLQALAMLGWVELRVQVVSHNLHGATSPEKHRDEDSHGMQGRPAACAASYKHSLSVKKCFQKRSHASNARGALNPIPYPTMTALLN